VTAAAPPSGGAPGETPRARILLVDDDERNLLALAEVLEPIADVVCVDSGRLALRELLKDDFAVILLDVFMPEMDGYETANLVRQRPQTARIPIIFLSAVNKETEHLMRGYAMGAVDYVFKPVDPVVLKSKVAVFVDLFEKTREVERKAAQEQALLDANLRANAELLKAEQDLRRAEERQAAIIQSLPMVLYLEPYCETRQVPDFVSGDIEAMTGLKYDDLKANPDIWFERVHPDDRERLVEALRQRSGVSGKLSIEYRWQCADGNYKHVLDQAVLLRDHDGNPLEFAGSVIDVTAQRELEKQLVQSRKAEALGQLTGGVAHDFNNLLSAVLGGVGLLERRLELGERERQIFEQMRHAAQNGVELVKRLMSFARKQELSPTSIDPVQLRHAVAGLVDHALGDGVSVEWSVPDPDVRLLADEAQLELSLVNLIFNARDAMPDGGTIAVAIEPGEMPGEASSPGDRPRCVKVRVVDQGVGIPSEMLERVTEPFFTTKAAGKGTGLGLSMVAGFVQQSGGVFRIESEVGRGTGIELYFPVAGAGGQRPQAAAADDFAGRLVGSVRVVDDDAGVRLVVAEQLRDLGIAVSEAESASHALALLDDGVTAEFVLSDFAMPGMDGLDLLESVRRKYPHLKGAIMTGNPQGKLSACDPAIPVLQKPIQPYALREVLSLA
jgi:PAS domain S-box-containing protein